MPLDPALLKLRWGITDDSKDALVDQVAAQAQALAEQYTGRRFDLADDAEDFDAVFSAFQVRRFPITAISALWYWRPGNPPDDPPTGTGISNYVVNRAAGVVQLASARGGWPGLLHCDYRGGFDPWPVDLTLGITQIADLLWNDTPGGGAPIGAPGALGQLKKLSVVGVYSAELEDAGSASGEGWGVLPQSITDFLDYWRIGAVIGIG